MGTPGQPGGQAPEGHLPEAHLPSGGSVTADLGWEDDDRTWGGILLSAQQFVPMFSSGQEFFVLAGSASNSPDFFLERVGLCEERGYFVQGQMVWPHIAGPAGSAIQISLGAHETPEGAIDWEGPYDFVIGQDEYLDFWVSGRFLAIRFESSGIPVWTLQSFQVDYERIGKV